MVPEASEVLIFPKARENPEQLGSKTKCQQATHRTKPVEMSCKQPQAWRPPQNYAQKAAEQLWGLKPSGSSPRRGQVHLRAATRPGWYPDCGLATRSSVCDQPGAHIEGTLWGVKQKPSRTGQRKQKESRGAEPRITDSTSNTTWKLWKRSSEKPANLHCLLLKV